MSTEIAIALIVMLVLLFIKVPVFLSVIGGSAVYFLMNPDVGSLILGQRLVSSIQNLSLLAIPFFVCSGVFMNYSGVTRRIMALCDILTGRLWGGLAQVNVLLSTLMGGLSGSSLADAAMEARMLVPEMEKKGMSKEFSSVVTAASAMITPLIPPGIAMILCGSCGEGGHPADVPAGHHHRRCSPGGVHCDRGRCRGSCLLCPAGPFLPGTGLEDDQGRLV